MNTEPLWKISFHGRINRNRFLLGQVVGVAIFLPGLFSSLVFNEKIARVVLLLTLFYGLLVTVSLLVRRLHDVGKSGWFTIFAVIPFANLYLFYLAWLSVGTDEPNQYG